MAYKLKTTGIAALCKMAVAVDPDTGTIKDFASAAVTAAMTVGANVTIGSQAWNGTTRSYFRQGSGTTAADFVAFGATKPQFSANATETTQTVVFIGEVAGTQARVIGNSSSDYFASQNLGSGGATYPTALINSVAYSGVNAALASGNKVIFGWALVRGGAANSSLIYTAMHDGTSRTTTTKTLSAINVSYALSYIGRRNDTTSHQQDKIHAILIFNSALTAADFDTLQADWFGVLLESAGGGAVDATADGVTLTGTAALTPGTATGGYGAVDATAEGVTLTGTSTLTPGTATGGASGSFVSSPMYSSGILQASVALDWTWYPGAIGAAPTAALVHGSGATAGDGTLTAAGLSAGSGFLLAETADGAIYYEAGTVI